MNEIYANVCGSCGWIIEDPDFVTVTEVCPSCGARAFYVPIIQAREICEEIMLSEKHPSLSNFQVRKKPASKEVEGVPPIDLTSVLVQLDNTLQRLDRLEEAFNLKFNNLIAVLNSKFELNDQEKLIMDLLQQKLMKDG